MKLALFYSPEAKHVPIRLLMFFFYHRMYILIKYFKTQINFFTEITLKVSNCAVPLWPRCDLDLKSAVLCCSLAFPLHSDIHPQLCGHMCTWWLSDEKVARFHIQVWHIEKWKDACGALVGKDSDIRTQFHSLSLRYTYIHTQLLVSSTDEFWENKQLQEEERTIRLDGLPNFIIYYGLPEMHTLLQPGACLTFTCNHKSAGAHAHTRVLFVHTPWYTMLQHFKPQTPI